MIWSRFDRVGNDLSIPEQSTPMLTSDAFIKYLSVNKRCLKQTRSSNTGFRVPSILQLGSPMNRLISSNKQISTQLCRETMFRNNFDWMKSVAISLTVIPKIPINDVPTSVQIMDCHRLGDRPLSESMPTCLLTYKCVTRSHRVKSSNILVLDIRQNPYENISRAFHHITRERFENTLLLEAEWRIYASVN